MNDDYWLSAQPVDAPQVMDSIYSHEQECLLVGFPAKDYGGVRYLGRSDWIRHELHRLETESSPNNFEHGFVFLSPRPLYKDNGDRSFP